jgi:hypothetical protein
MAHFAEIDETNTVLRVIVVADEETADENGSEVESIGAQFCADLLGGTWIQTSYNTQSNVHSDGGTPLHMNYASIGYSWDGTGFAAPQPYPSWSLDENYVWQPPTPMPDDGLLYEWDEATTSWVEITE